MFCKKCGEALDDDAEFCTNCGAKIKAKKNVTKEQAIINVEKEDTKLEKYDKNTILDFLEKAKLLETRKYGLQQAKAKLEDEIYEYSTDIEPENLSYKKIRLRDFNPFDDDTYCFWLATIAGVVAFLYVVSSAGISFLEAIIYTITCIFLFSGVFWKALFVGIGVFVGIMLLLKLIEFTFFAIKMMIKNGKINKEQKELNAKIEIENEVNSYALAKSEEELKIVKSDLKETKKVLKEVYQVGILYDKYCNMIAVSTIYEYLKSGRCQTLQGYTGAYNIYENEVRQDIIIGKLDNILASLEQVKRNQYILYCAIQQASEITQNALNEARQAVETVNQLGTSMNESIRNTEYNTKQIAENTEILTWVAALK